MLEISKKLSLQENAIHCMKTGQLTLFTDIINEAVKDDLESKGQVLPQDHWINQSLKSEISEKRTKTECVNTDYWAVAIILLVLALVLVLVLVLIPILALQKTCS